MDGDRFFENLPLSLDDVKDYQADLSREKTIRACGYAVIFGGLTLALATGESGLIATCIPGIVFVINSERSISEADTVLEINKEMTERFGEVDSP